MPAAFASASAVAAWGPYTGSRAPLVKMASSSLICVDLEDGGGLLRSRRRPGSRRNTVFTVLSAEPSSGSSSPEMSSIEPKSSGLLAAERECAFAAVGVSRHGPLGPAAATLRFLWM